MNRPLRSLRVPTALSLLLLLPIIGAGACSPAASPPDEISGVVVKTMIAETDPIAIDQIPVYSSAEGFVLYPDHEYEIESVYDNRSGAPVDAMAVMYLHHHPLNDERITYPIPQPPAADAGHHH